MALTESTSTNLAIDASGIVFVEAKTTIFRDGLEIATETNRTGYHPGADASQLPPNVQAICAATWTPEIIAAWNEKLRLSAIPTEPLQ
jgi:hypothetical protein